MIVLTPPCELEIFNRTEVLGVRCGESRSPVLSPGSKERRRETGPAAMGHPPWTEAVE